MKIKELVRESWAVALRNLKLNFNPVKEIFIIIIITFFLIGLSVGVNFINGEKTSLEEYIKFFTSGILGYMIITASFALGGNLISEKRGFSKILLSAPISRISILLGRMIYLILGAARSYFIIFIIIMILTHEITLTKVLLIMLLIIMTILIFLGLSFMIAAFINKRESWNFIVSISTMIFLFFSGSFYNINNLPVLLRYLTYLNPATYCIEGLRYVVDGVSQINVIFLMIILVSMTLIFPILGTLLYEKKLREG